MQTFLDIKAARSFIEQAMSQHLAQKSPGWFTDWLDDLYIRLGEAPGPITLAEMNALSRLYTDGSWTPQMIACNQVYKMLDALGRDTSGIAGY